MRTKTTKPATKTMRETLNGHIQKRKVRCGKTNCKCARGEPHTAFYRVWYHGGRRYRQYIRKAEVEKALTACQNHRNLQIKLRAGRIEYKQVIGRARLLLRMLS